VNGTDQILPPPSRNSRTLKKVARKIDKEVMKKHSTYRQKYKPFSVTHVQNNMSLQLAVTNVV